MNKGTALVGDGSKSTVAPGLHLLATATFFLSLLSAWLYIHQSLPPTALPDFTVFYAAAQPGPIYDVAWITAQQPQIGGPRPFAYPPTFVLLLRFLQPLQYEAAFAVWTATSMTVFIAAARLASPRLWWAALLSPLVILSVRIGQTPLLIGGLLTLGLLHLRRPTLAGIFLGLAFALKPPIMLLLPPALVLWGQWRALLVMGATGLVFCAATLPLGLHLWVDWLGALPEFQQINERMGVATTPLRSSIILGAAGLVVLHLVRESTDNVRMIAVIGGSIVAAPHAGTYEWAMLVPALVGFAYPVRWRTAPALVLYASRFKPLWLQALCVLVLSLGQELEAQVRRLQHVLSTRGR